MIMHSNLDCVKELHTTGHNAPDIDTLHNGMWELHQLSDRLPPLSDREFYPHAFGPVLTLTS